MNLRSPEAYIDELFNEAETLARNNHISIVVIYQETAYFISHKDENPRKELTELMRKGGAPLGLIKFSPTGVTLSREGISFEKKFWYRRFHDTVKSENENNFLQNFIVGSAKADLEKIKVLNSKYFFELVFGNNSSQDGYFEIVIFLSTQFGTNKSKLI